MDAHAQVIVFNFLYIEYIRRRNPVRKRQYPEQKAAVQLPEEQRPGFPLPELLPSQLLRPGFPSWLRGQELQQSYQRPSQVLRPGLFPQEFQRQEPGFPQTGYQ